MTTAFPITSASCCPPSAPFNPSSNWSSNFSSPSFNNWNNMPSSWSWPSHFGSQFPSTFAGQFPSSWTNFAGQCPSSWSNFAGQCPSSWSNFGAFPAPWSNNTYPSSWPSTFGANPWSPMSFASNNWTNNFSAEHSWNKHVLPREIRDVSFRPVSVAEYWTLSNPIQIHPIDGSRKLQLCFDVLGFKPEEVNVSISTKDRTFTVECKYEVKEKEHQAIRSYTRKYTIPSEYCVDLSKCELKSHVTVDGLLVIEGFLPRYTAEELKTIKEKCPSKLAGGAFESSPYSFGAHHGNNFAAHVAVSIPIKTIA